MDRVLRDTAFTAQVVNADANGDPVDVPGVWTADVTDSAGVAIAGSPFAVTHTTPGSGLYEITPGLIHQLDVYSVQWNVPDGSKRRTAFEIVGGFYFSFAELRAGAKDLDATSFPAAKIAAVRSEVESRFEKRARVAFVPRGRRERVDGTGTGKLILDALYPRQVVSVSVDGVAFAGADLTGLVAYDTGVVVRPSGTWNWGARNVAILYEHGLDAPPEPIKAKAIKYARYLLAPHPFDDDRALSVDTGAGVVRYTTARDGSTGFPDIDAVLDLFGSPRPGFA